MKKTNLLFGIHCHQPVDNFDKVLYEAIEKSYKPFFKILKEFPTFKCSVHYSGWLLEFIQKNDPELFALMQSLSNQIEFFTGGYYEPILAAIPSKDRIAQINKLSIYIKKYFNQEPKGLWLTERVWDNSIIKDLVECGIEYVIVDDYHFIANGYNRDNLNGYFLTEEGGEKIALFPIHQELRYQIPFGSLEQVEKTLHTFEAEDGKNAAIIFDDGEKFGIWPKTFEMVYEKEWLRDFFRQSVEDEKINIQFFSEFYNSNVPISLAYLPTLSYQEMGSWSFGADDSNRLEDLLHSVPDSSKFIKGGIWKNFLTKYPESNWIHKRILELSSKALEDDEYLDALYRAECNDVLWHGVFGGIYLPNLRDSAYRYIIECEKLLKRKYSVMDIDFDGRDEYLFNQKDLIFIFSPHGGQLCELDVKEKNFNLQNSMTRHRESYHSKIEISDKKTEDEISTIHDNRLQIDKDVSIDYDWYLKRSMIDHIGDDLLSVDNFKSCSFGEYGDFANQVFDILSSDENSIAFKREGGIYQNAHYATSIEKQIKLSDDFIEVKIDLNTLYDKQLRYLHEWNLHFPNINSIKINDKKLDDKLIFKTNTLTIRDEILDKVFKFNFKEHIEVFVVCIDTVSQSESGVDVTSQGVSFGFVKSFEKLLSFEYKFSISE